MNQNKVVAGVIIFGLVSSVFAIGFIIYQQGSKPRSITTEQSTSSAQGGTIAVLAQGSASQANQSAAPEPVQQVETIITVPSDWSSAEPSVPVPCGNSEMWQASAWQSGTKSLTIFESSESVTCDASFAADSLVSYSFKPNTATILVDASNTYGMCTKEQNPQCPRGDGALSILLINTDDTKKTEVLAATKKSYVFHMQDTSLQADLTAQAQTMAKSLETITLYQSNTPTQE